jgi:hypothetical protein
VPTNVLGGVDSVSLADYASLGCYSVNFIVPQVASALMNFIQTMVSHPHIQLKAQHELDSVLPPGALPTIQDMKNLPYVTALVRETLRWKPLTPFGVNLS